MIHLLRLSAVPACAVAILLHAAAVSAQLCELRKFTASDASQSDNFGRAVSLSNTVAVFGARGNDDAGLDAGAVYVFRRTGSTWTEEQKLFAADPALGDAFGTDLAVDGDTILIGADGGDDRGNRSGVAYVFRFLDGEWTQTQKLTAPDGGTDDRFGVAVSLRGTTAVIGAIGDDDRGNDAGAAYVFQFDGATWNFAQKLVAADGVSGDRLGSAIAAAEGVFIAGVREDFHSGRPAAGSAYVFREIDGTWAQEQKLTLSQPAANDDFGISVAIRGDVVVVGAIGDDVVGSNAGAAHVFRYTGAKWIYEAELIGSDIVFDDYLGDSVGITQPPTGGLVVGVGARLDRDAGNTAGSVYLFERQASGWVETQKLLASDADVSDNFGVSVALSGDVVLAGAWENDDGGANSGSAYAFEITLSDCNSNLICDGLELNDNDCNANETPDQCDIASGASEDCSGDGIPDECFACADDCECDDGDACTGVEACLSGECVPGMPVVCDDGNPANGLETCDPGTGACSPGKIIDCNANGIDDPYEIEHCPGEPACADCNLNEVPDDCDISAGSPDVNENGMPDECEPTCGTNRFCDDGSVCSFDTCSDGICYRTQAKHGDLAGAGATCGPDSVVDLFDIFVVLDGFVGTFPAGCELQNMDVASSASRCGTDGVINLFDIFVVLDAFQGIESCCNESP